MVHGATPEDVRKDEEGILLDKNFYAEKE